MNQPGNARSGWDTTRQTSFVLGGHVALVPGARKDLPYAFHIHRSAIRKMIADVCVRRVGKACRNLLVCVLRRRSDEVRDIKIDPRKRRIYTLHDFNAWSRALR